MIIEIFITLFLIIFISLTVVWGIGMVIAMGFALYTMGYMLWDITFDPHGVWR